jgi:hypothetical protein
MKKILLIGSLLMLLATAAEAQRHPAMEARFGVFYSNLSGYGEWIDCNYGYAWRPRHVAVHWRPYMMGRWIWTDYGWYWSSTEPFGWATYHYGRWIYDDYYGWVWVPDDVWGPAWVEWRYDDDYIGWCPLSPYATFNINVGISYSRNWSAPVYYWNFVPYRNFTSIRVNDYVQPVERSRRIFGSTRSTVNIRGDAHRVINQGVDVDIVRRRGHVDVERTEVVHSDRTSGDRVVRSGGREKIEVFRPRIDATGEPDRMQRQRDGNRNGAFDQPQRRNAQEEERMRDQREGRPEVQQRQERQNQRDVRPEVQQRQERQNQRDVRPEVQQRQERQNQRDVRPEVQQRQERQNQRDVRPEVQRRPEERQRMQREESRRDFDRREPMPQSRERMKQQEQEKRVAPGGGRSQERKQTQEKPRQRGRRPF